MNKIIIVILMAAALILLSGVDTTIITPVVTPQEIVVTLNDVTKVTFIKKNYESNVEPEYQPHKGYIYIIANITLKNNGYESFHLYSPELHLIYNNVSYTRVYSSYHDINNVFPTRLDILNGGAITGNIVFELPENTSGYEVRYNGIEMYYDEQINYIPHKW